MIKRLDLADQTFAFGALHGALAGLFYGATAIGTHYLDQKKSLKLFLIDASYELLY